MSMGFDNNQKQSFIIRPYKQYIYTTGKENKAYNKHSSTKQPSLKHPQSVT